jgi:PAS domain S-box-containing protein
MRGTRESLIGREIFEALPTAAEDRRMLRRSLERARDLKVVDALSLQSYAIPGTQFGPRDWQCVHVPIPDDSGRIVSVLQCIQDLSDSRRLGVIPTNTNGRDGSADVIFLEKAAEIQALNRSLWAETVHLRNLFIQAPSFMCVLRGPEHVFELVNLAFLKLVGQRDLLGKTIREALPESSGQEYAEMLDHVFRTGEPFVGRRMSTRIQSGSSGPVEEHILDFVLQPIAEADGQVSGIFIEGSDVTEHVHAEERRALLIRELHHRVRNTLATVQSVMNSTARSSDTIENFQESFAGRLNSLAKTHALLTEELEQSVAFVHLLRQELGSYTDLQQDRIHLEGPFIELPSSMAIPLGMAIHELTDNAEKFGALARENGRVEVSWNIVTREGTRSLFCEWREQGGPPVAPPTRMGFGSMLLNRVLSQQMGAEVDVDYSEEGFRMRLILPFPLPQATVGSP